MKTILQNCITLRQAYDNGLLGNQIMPEDTHPEFKNLEDKLSFFTLPMSLNYQRNSYSLWTAATSSHEDQLTCSIFDVNAVATMSDEQLRSLLLTHKVALQPNKHTHTWQTIATTVSYSLWTAATSSHEDLAHCIVVMIRRWKNYINYTVSKVWY